MKKEITEQEYSFLNKIIVKMRDNLNLLQVRWVEQNVFN